MKIINTVTVTKINGFSHHAILKAYDNNDKLIVVQGLNGYGTVDCNGNPVAWAISSIMDEYPEVTYMKIENN